MHKHAEYRKGQKFRGRIQPPEALCAQPEFAKAIRELRPKGLGRNKQIVADLIGSGRFGTLTALYRLKNHM